MKRKKWNIEVIFIGDYEIQFEKDESQEQKDSERMFSSSIIKIMEDTGIVPQAGDWIKPLTKNHYNLDIGRVASRNFYPSEKKIVFEIE